jgi:long-chain acyl-CoA synthetase
MASTHVNSLYETSAASEKLLSFVTGSTHEELQNTTLGRLLEEKAVENPKAQCLVFSEVNKRFTYCELYKRSLDVGKALIAHGVKKGDRVGILAGNCSPYVELIFACSHVGAALVVLNIAYTVSEIKAAVTHAGILRFW